MNITINPQFSKSNNKQQQNNLSTGSLQKTNIPLVENDQFLKSNLSIKKERQEIGFTGRGSSVIKRLVKTLSRKVEPDIKSLREVKPLREGAITTGMTDKKLPDTPGARNARAALKELKTHGVDTDKYKLDKDGEMKPIDKIFARQDAEKMKPNHPGENITRVKEKTRQHITSGSNPEHHYDGHSDIPIDDAHEHAHGTIIDGLADNAADGATDATIQPDDDILSDDVINGIGNKITHGIDVGVHATEHLAEAAVQGAEALLEIAGHKAESAIETAGHKAEGFIEGLINIITDKL